MKASIALRPKTTPDMRKSVGFGAIPFVLDSLRADAPKPQQLPPLAPPPSNTRTTGIGFRNKVTFHDLRHTHTSLMLNPGGDLKVINACLGHAEFATTENIYAHLMQGAQADATEKLDKMLRQSKSQ